MNTAYKIIMIVVGCVVAYFLMSLATNSQKMAQGISSQSEELKSIASLNNRIEIIEKQLSSNSKDLKEVGGKINNNADSIINIKELKREVNELKGRVLSITDNTSDKGAAVEISELEKAIDAKLNRLSSENDSIRKELSARNDEIMKLQAQLEKNEALVKALDCSSSEELNAKLDELMASASDLGLEAYNRMQDKISALSEKMDGVKDSLAEYKAMSIEKTKEINEELKGRISDLKADYKERIAELKAMYKSGEAETTQMLRAVEKATADKIKKTTDWVNTEIEGLTEKYNNEISPDIDVTVKKITDKVSVEIENIKQEFSGLQKKVSGMLQDDARKSEPVGIVVNEVFEKSLVMINTAEGTFVFNPYADFTGVVRVRDGAGNEKMVLVPYTGDYMKIGENIVDTGPFARNCVLGINCNIDVRGSANAPVVK